MHHVGYVSTEVSVFFVVVYVCSHECVLLRDGYKDNSNAKGTLEGQLDQALRSCDM